MDKRVIIAFVVSMLFMTVYNAVVLKPMLDKKSQQKEMTVHDPATVDSKEEQQRATQSFDKKRAIVKRGSENLSELILDNSNTYYISKSGIIAVEQVINGERERFDFAYPQGVAIPSDDTVFDWKKGKGLSWTAQGAKVFWEKEDKGVVSQTIAPFKKAILITGPLFPKDTGKKSKGRYAKFNNGVIIGWENKGKVFIRKIPLYKEKKIMEALSRKVLFAGVYDKYRVSVVKFLEPQQVMFVNEKEYYGFTWLLDKDKNKVKTLWYAGLSRPELMGLFPYKKQITKRSFFAGITDILLVVLKMFYKITKSWGAAIILLAIAFSLVFLPLTLKSYASIKKMQKIQPELKALQEKYKDDHETLNRELVLLYHKHNVNPFSGCLPLFLQLPVFFALYPVLLNTYELKKASFLWISDLSAPDSVSLFGIDLHLLPIILTILMFFQQKFTASTTSDGAVDSQQAMMMKVMPVVFLLIFYNMPSGLVLFWVVMGIGNFLQQIYLSRIKE